jgi:hypothetical protein
MTKKKQRRKSLSIKRKKKNSIISNNDKLIKRKIKDNVNQEYQLNNEHIQSILVKKPFEKHLSVQFI